MTVLQSGHVETGNNTPTGAAFQYAVDNPYVTIDDFINSSEAAGLGITNASAIYTSGELASKILQASASVNRYCRRYFDTQTIDEQKTGFIVRPYNPQLVTVVLKNAPYQKINSIYIQVLKWFISVDVTSTTGYLQDFYFPGYYKIVPLLSSAGQGIGSPIPAAILDRVPLGVLWTNYTFGYGTALVKEPMTATMDYTVYQAPLSNRCWAKGPGVLVYVNGTLVADSTYTLDYVNGKVIMNNALTANDTVTASFTTNQSVPFEIQEATILITAWLIGQGSQNPLGATGFNIQTFAINFGGEDNDLLKRAKTRLDPWVRNMPEFI